MTGNTPEQHRRYSQTYSDKKREQGFVRMTLWIRPEWRGKVLGFLKLLNEEVGD